MDTIIPQQKEGKLPIRLQGQTFGGASAATVSLTQTVSDHLARNRERVVSLLEAIREPLRLDEERAEWLAKQLLEAGEKGILVPANIVLDAYTRGKARYYLRKHFFRTGLVLAFTCTAVHLIKKAAKRTTQRIPVVGAATRFICDVALPTSLLAMAAVAKILL
eukprot:jgi/Botrbrau1/2247/Bobra.101_2s0075.2